jgi:hypothetical protein
MPFLHNYCFPYGWYTNIRHAFIRYTHCNPKKNENIFRITVYIIFIKRFTYRQRSPLLCSKNRAGHIWMPSICVMNSSLHFGDSIFVVKYFAPPAVVININGHIEKCMTRTSGIWLSSIWQLRWKVNDKSKKSRNCLWPKLVPSPLLLIYTKHSFSNIF